MDDDNYQLGIGDLPHGGACDLSPADPSREGIGQLSPRDWHEAPAGTPPALLHKQEEFGIP